MIKQYKIDVQGCDDHTEIIKKLTDEQARLVRRIAVAITNASEYGCMPRMSIEEYIPNQQKRS